MSFNPQDFVTPYVTQEEVLEIKKAFDLFDRDLGGAIDPRELKVAINSLGIEAKAQAVYQMIAELDQDGSGQIEFPEFFYMMTTRPSDNETRDEVHKVFITFDSQKTGTIFFTQDSLLLRTSARLPRILENSLTIMSFRK